MVDPLNARGILAAGSMAHPTREAGQPCRPAARTAARRPSHASPQGPSRPRPRGASRLGWLAGSCRFFVRRPARRPRRPLLPAPCRALPPPRRPLLSLCPAGLGSPGSLSVARRRSPSCSAPLPARASGSRSRCWLSRVFGVVGAVGPLSTHQPCLGERGRRQNRRRNRRAQAADPGRQRPGGEDRKARADAGRSSGPAGSRPGQQRGAPRRPAPRVHPGRRAPPEPRRGRRARRGLWVVCHRAAYWARGGSNCAVPHVCLW